jgi:glucan phosphoethanolaminetransferase (alkaline phosphatase superfamily)
MSSNDTLVFILIVPAVILVVKFRKPIATVLIVSAATAFFYGVYKIPSVLNEILNVTNVH